MANCILCAGEAEIFLPDYFHCTRCDLRFLDPNLRLSRDEESSRYGLHQNQSRDPAYQRFVGPAVDLILQRIQRPAFGLDFGCGADSAVIRLLSDANYEMSAYDPLYFPNMKVLERQYSFVVATEVIEHLHRPDEVFKSLRGMLKAGGALILMTHVFSDSIDFASWYYRRDPTHVAFYSARTFKWIEEEFAFTGLEIHGDRAIWLQAR